MKISNWCKKASFALVAAGWFLPVDVMAAVNIPLGDPSFENVVIPTNVAASAQYAYARDAPGKFQYRPATGPSSPWISRIDDNIPGFPYTQDGGPTGSNWIYSAAYAELNTPNFISDPNDPNSGRNNPGQILVGKRPAPRTGNQAMHGRGHTNGQEIPAATAVFEAGKQYTFSIYAQGDSNAEIFSTGWQSRAYLFLYDATVPFRNPAIHPDFAYSDPNGFQALTYDPSLHDPNSPNYSYFPPDRFAPDEPTPPENTVTHPGQFINRPASATAAQSKAAWQQISVSWLVLPGASEIGHPMGVAFRVIDDGAVDDAALTATGAGVGDFNLDGAFTVADWNVLRTHQLQNLSSFSAKQQYLAGDLNGDGFNNFTDFSLFKSAYDHANGTGAFVAMIASVPEPSSILLVSAMGVSLTLGRKRPV